MLVALEKGVKGGKWYSLIDKVYNPSNLQSAFGKVRANGGASGVDHQSVEHFEKELARNIARLSDELQKGTYVPQAVRRVWIPKPGTSEQRPLGIPTIRDRVVQGALRNVLEPIFERDFAEHSYGFRRLRGCEGALDRVRDLLKQGYTHVVDVDLKGYFDSIPHDRLLAEVGRKVTDERILGLLRQFLIAGIRDGLDEQTPEREIGRAHV